MGPSEAAGPMTGGRRLIEVFDPDGNLFCVSNPLRIAGETPLCA